MSGAVESHGHSDDTMMQERGSRSRRAVRVLVVFQTSCSRDSISPEP